MDITVKEGITDKSYYKVIKEIIYVMLSFLIPFAILLVVFTSSDFALFKEEGKTLISYDMQSQYIAYLRYYKAILEGDHSFIYNQGKVFGGDFLSLYTYYLASPLNFFLPLCPNSSLPLFVIWTNIIKMCFSGTTFYMMSRLLSKKIRIGHLIFSTGYSLISFSIIYLSNFMWLDAVAILPLVVLGLEYLEKGRHKWVYSLSLAYSLFTSWYMGFMICIFAVIFFLYKFLSISKQDSISRRKFLLNFAFYSLLGGLLSSITWLTAFFHLKGTKASLSLSSFKFASPSLFLTGFLENNYSYSSIIAQNYGYISMFTGVVTIVFALRYFFNKAYTLRERLSAVAVFLIYFLFASNSLLNAIFHGGREPSWFPARYSFVIGFFLCYCGYKDFNEYLKSTKISCLGPLLGYLAIPIVLFLPNALTNAPDESYLHYTLSIPSLVIYSLSFLLSSIYPLFKGFKSVEKRANPALALTSLILLSLSAFSVYRGSDNIVKVNAEGDIYQSYETYLEDDRLSNRFKTIADLDSSLYRMESTFNRPGEYNTIDNNPMFYSYSGLNHYSSTSKKDVENFFQKLGFHNNGYFQKYDGGSTLAINSFLNVKYLIDDDKSTTNKPVFQKNNSEENFVKRLNVGDSDCTYYQNTKALSYAMLIDDSSASYISAGEYIKEEDNRVKYYDRFDFQNELFKSLTGDIKDEDGKSKDIFTQIPLTIRNTSSGLNVIGGKDDTYTLTGKRGDRITFSFTLPSEAILNNLYFEENKQVRDLTCYLDSRYYENSSYWHKGIRGFEDTRNHQHTLSFTLKSDLNEVEIRPVVYYEDLSVLNEYLDLLNKRSAYDLKEETSLFSYKIKGKIQITEDTKDKTLLFTLADSNDNVRIYIDEKEYDKVTRVNVFSAADFTSLDVGEHEIEFVYRDDGFFFSSIISLLSLIALISIAPISKVLATKKRRDYHNYLTNGL